MNTTILEKLESKRIFAQLHFGQTELGNAINLYADFFDDIIQLEIRSSNKASIQITHCHFSIKKHNGLLKTVGFLENSNVGHLVNHIVKAINSYVKSRPFTIVKYDRGQHKLLDPNGMDYIGQYVTLMDAKKSSRNNYII